MDLCRSDRSAEVLWEGCPHGFGSRHLQEVFKGRSGLLCVLGCQEIRAVPHPLLAGGFSLRLHFLWWAESPQEELERSHQLSGNVPMARTC